MTRQLHMEDALRMPLEDALKVMQEKVTHSTYFGIPTMKSPLDLWVYQEIIHKIKPDLIVEIGTYHGGSALWLAHLCDVLGQGRVISIDKNPLPVPTYALHHRINYVTCDAKDFDIATIQSPNLRMLVIEDSSHEYGQCLDVLRKYSSLVSVGSYLIVEDTICHHGLDVGPFPGPYEAVQDFLKENKNFEVDRSREPYLLTWNPGGYLKRVS